MASPSYVGCSSNVDISMTFDISEAEQLHSTITHNTIPSSKDIETEIVATQMNFTTIDHGTSDVIGQSVSVGENVVDVETEDLVNADKSEREDEAQEEDDDENADETQGGQDDGEPDKECGQDEMIEEPKTEREVDIESTHEMKEKIVKEVEMDNEQPEMEEDQQEEQKNQEINESEEQHVEMSEDLKTSAHSEELKEEEAAHGSGMIFDATLTSDEPQIKEKTSVITELEDPNAILNEDLEVCTNKDLNVAEDNLDVSKSRLGSFESDITAPQHKKHIVISKTEVHKHHKVHATVICRML